MYGYNAEPPIAIPIYTVLPYCVIHSTTVLCDIAIQWLAGLKVIRWNYCTRGCAQGEATYTMRLLIINIMPNYEVLCKSRDN